jgi:hypothetical protein
VNDVLLRSLPVRDPDRLVLLRHTPAANGSLTRAGENNISLDPATGRSSSTSFSLRTFEEFRAHHPGLSDVFAFAPFNQIDLLVDGVPETEVLGQLASGGYHEGLGVSTILGRPLTEDDDRVAAPPVAVLSWRFWQRRFGGDPSVIGKTVQVNRVPTVIVGVTRQGFAGAMQVGESADVTVPLALHARFQPDRGANRSQPWYWWLRVMGRLAPGATSAQASAALEPILQETAREGWRVSQSLAAATAGPMPDAPTLAADPGGQGENQSRLRVPPVAGSADGARRPRAPGRLRKRRDAPRRARRRAAAGDRRPPRPGREPGPHRAPIARGEPGAVRPGRDAGNRARLLGARPARRPPAVQWLRGVLEQSVDARAGLHDRGVRGHRDPVDWARPAREPRVDLAPEFRAARARQLPLAP